MDGATAILILEDLLDAAVASIGPTAPARQMVVHGAWAHDCQCVAVQATGIEVTSTDPGMCAAIDTLSVAVTILRCITTATGDEPIPAMSGINADALTLAFDLGQLVGGLGDRWAAGTLFPSLPQIQCGQVFIAGATAVGPEGGFGGWIVNLTVSP